MRDLSTNVLLCRDAESLECSMWFTDVSVWFTDDEAKVFADCLDPQHQDMGTGHGLRAGERPRVQILVATQSTDQT